MQIRFFGKGRIPVIVPTASFHGPLFESFRNRLSDQLVVGVESSGNGFNFSRSVNHGIRAAVSEYNPAHIIVSNDDVSVTNPQVAVMHQAAESMSHSCAYLVPLINSCSNPIALISSDTASLLAQIMRARTRSTGMRQNRGNLTKDFLEPLLSLVYFNHYRRALLKTCRAFLDEERKQFRIYSVVPMSERLAKGLKVIYMGQWAGCFALYNVALLEKTGCLDERYTNGFEDFDLMYRLSVVHRYQNSLVDAVNVKHEADSSLGTPSAHYYKLYMAIMRPELPCSSPTDKRIRNDLLNEVIFQHVVNGIGMSSHASDFITRSRKGLGIGN